MAAEALVAEKEQTTDRFVADVWTKKGDPWQLSARYLSAAPSLPPTPVKPSGKP